MFTNDLFGIDMRKSKLLLNKPVYTGMTILDDSKILMYDFFYNELKKKYGPKCELLYTDTDSLLLEKKKYGPKCELLYTDTDSLLLEIETDDVYKGIETNKNLYDTSDYPKEHPLYSDDNKKVLGKMKTNVMEFQLKSAPV